MDCPEASARATLNQGKSHFLMTMAPDYSQSTQPSRSKDLFLFSSD